MFCSRPEGIGRICTTGSGCCSEDPSLGHPPSAETAVQESSQAGQKRPDCLRDRDSGAWVFFLSQACRSEISVGEFSSLFGGFGRLPVPRCSAVDTVNAATKASLKQ